MRIERDEARPRSRRPERKETTPSGTVKAASLVTVTANEISALRSWGHRMHDQRSTLAVSCGAVVPRDVETPQ